MTRVVVIMVSLLLLSCGGTPHSGKRSETGVLLIQASPSDAMLTINGKLIGPVAQVPKGLRMSVGQKRVEIYKSGFYRFYRLVNVTAGQPVTVETVLLEKPAF